MASKNSYQHHNRGSSNNNNSGPSGTGPGDFLNKIKGKRVFVKLNDSTVYAGAFICMDGNLNVVMENVTLYDSMEQAQSTNPKDREASNEVFSDVFIRGNNVCYIVPASGGSSD